MNKRVLAAALAVFLLPSPASADDTRPIDLQTAIATFQRAKGLPASGTVDAATLSAIDAAAQAQTSAPARPAARGRFGAAVETAKADGIVDAADVKKMFAAAGAEVSQNEMQEIRAVVFNRAAGATWEVKDEAVVEARARAATAKRFSRSPCCRSASCSAISAGRYARCSKQKQ